DPQGRRRHRLHHRLARLAPGPRGPGAPSMKETHMPGFIGMPELIVLGLVLLLIFGPKRLPEMGRSMGRGMREFKESISGEHKDELAELATVPVVAPDEHVELATVPVVVR